MTPEAVSRSVYGRNPFVEAPAIARYLREHTAPGDRIAVVGSEPEIYFYAGRPSATGYIYTYALMEPQPYASRMQTEMIQEIESARPKYLVGVLIQSSWLAQPNSDRRILSWLDRYTASCYDVAGVVDIGEHETTWRWEAEVAGYTPRSSNLVYVYRRKSAEPCTVDR
jgi:hypothetical protein